MLSTGEQAVAAALTRRLICWHQTDSQKKGNPGLGKVIEARGHETGQCVAGGVDQDFRRPPRR